MFGDRSSARRYFRQAALLAQPEEKQQIASVSQKCFLVQIGMKIIRYITRNELASLAHSFYTCLKHQLMHQLYSSALSWIMLHA